MQMLSSVPDNDDIDGNTPMSSALRSSVLPSVYAFSSFRVFSPRVMSLTGAEAGTHAQLDARWTLPD
jgi:hypothetical protein